ncbi:MAG TPA: hypothetical protein IAA98_15875 [Candidatus Avipropionibacterium avicola]|uniref:Uncharacterized protein n=1 Tax=Candidatus Avipropionibacterium avicola TaxID=2840701 RepID=A0A9D1KPN8_9ACTN|nr:hypothetical protein [Candidatus Avipropionibacterium avicola]
MTTVTSAVLLAAQVGASRAAPPTDQDGPSTGTPNHATMLGDFAAPVWLPDTGDGIRRIDIPATLDALEEAHVNTYAYILSGGAQYGDAGRGIVTEAQWNAFPAFADAAAERGIDVYLYMSGPSGSALDTSVPRPEQKPGNKPYGWDYLAWAEELAKVSVDHPNVGGLMLDDFNANTPQENSPWAFSFTPDYVREMSALARAHNPDFQIYGVIYQPSLSTAAAFRDALDGVIFPYRGETSTPGTGDPSTARSEGEVYGDLSHCWSDRCVQFRGSGDSADGDLAEVKRTVAVDAAAQEHVLTMQVNNDNYREPCDDGRCFLFSMPGHSPTQDGDYIAISQEVELSGDGPRELSFRVGDSTRRSTFGYHMLQALVDGEVVAERDAAGMNDWEQLSIDVSEQLEGKDHATLTFRLHNPQGVENFGIRTWIDDIALTGAEIADPSFDDRTSGAWQQSNVGEVMKAQYTAGTYTLETVVAGEVVAEHPIEGYDGWSSITQDLTAALAGRSTAEVSVRLRATDDLDDEIRTVWIDDVEISGTDVAAEDFDTSWQVDSGPTIEARSVASHTTIWMTYASRLAADEPGHQPSADYIEEVQSAGMSLMAEGLFDGSLVYVMNLSDPVTSSAGEERARIGQLYGDWEASDRSTCDEVVSGTHRGGVTVTQGRTCLVGAEVSGPVEVAEGAELLVDSSTLRGKLAVTGGAVAVCDSELAGSVVLTDASAVRLGATPYLCGGNTIRGSVQITGTTSDFAVAALRLRGSLGCEGNVAAPDQRGEPSSISGSASGDCAALAA